MSWRFWVSGKTVRKFEELPIYYQRQNCSPGNLVSSNVRFMWIFEGVCWKGGVKWVWGRRKWRFSLLSLAISSEPSHSWPQLLYCIMYPYSGSSLTPWMTLNGHIALKSGPSSASNALPFWLSEKTVQKFAELRITDCQRQKKCSPANTVCKM